MKASSDDSSTGTSPSSPRTASRTAVASVACCSELRRPYDDVHRVARAERLLVGRDEHLGRRGLDERPVVDVADDADDREDRIDPVHPSELEAHADRIRAVEELPRERLIHDRGRDALPRDRPRSARAR